MANISKKLIDGTAGNSVGPYIQYEVVASPMGGETHTTGGITVIKFPYSRMTISDIPEYAPDGHQIIAIRRTYNIVGTIILVDGGSDEAGTFYEIRKILESPRGLFSVYDSTPAAGRGKRATQTIIDQVDPSDMSSQFADFDYGPHPEQVTVTKFTRNAYEVNWTLRCYIKQCFGSSGVTVPTARIIARAVKYDYAVDNCGYTSKSTNGYLKIRPDKDGKTVDDFIKSEIDAKAPPMTGFKRVNTGRDISVDGLECQWSTTDTQVYRPLPEQICMGDYSFKVTTQAIGKDGFMIESAYCTLTLAGTFYGGPTNDRVAGKNLILGHIVNLADTYFKDKLYYTAREITEHGYDNGIDFVLVALAASQGQIDTVHISGLDRFGVSVPAGDKKFEQDTPTYISPTGGTGQTTDVAYIRPGFKIFDACVTESPGNTCTTPITTTTANTTCPGQTSTTSSQNATAATSTKKPATGDASFRIINWEEWISIEQETGKKVLVPKDSSTPLVVQQIIRPRYRIIQSGHRAAVCNNQPPRVAMIPPPIIATEGANPRAVMLNRSDAWSPMSGANNNIYSLNYRYVMELIQTPQATDFVFGADPSIQGSQTVQIDYPIGTIAGSATSPFTTMVSPLSVIK